MHWYESIRDVLQDKKMTTNEIAQAIFGEPTLEQVGRTSAHMHRLERQGFCRRCGTVTVKGNTRQIWELI